MLGGAFRNRVQAYATGLFCRNSEDQTGALVAEARGYADQGFKAMVSVPEGPGFGIEINRDLLEKYG